MRVSFVAVKRYVDINTVIGWLGLKKVAPDRYDCPHGEPKNRGISVNTRWKNKDGSLGRFTCWICGTAGDLIALAAHINKTDDKKAALAIQKEFHSYEPKQKGLPADGLDYLEYDHPTILAMGFTPEKAKEHGIGFAPKGILRNCIAIPIRDKQGALKGYLGYNDLGFKVPNSLK